MSALHTAVYPVTPFPDEQAFDYYTWLAQQEYYKQVYEMETLEVSGPRF